MRVRAALLGVRPAEGGDSGVERFAHHTCLRADVLARGWGENAADSAAYGRRRVSI